MSRGPIRISAVVALVVLSCGFWARAEEPKLYPIVKDRKTGLIDQTGKLVVQPTFDSIREFHEGLAVAATNGKEGYIDSTGQGRHRAPILQRLGFLAGAGAGVCRRR